MKCFFRINHRCRQRELASEASLFVRVLSMMGCARGGNSLANTPSLCLPACLPVTEAQNRLVLTQAHNAAQACGNH